MYIHMYMYIHIYICIYTHIRAYTCFYVYIHLQYPGTATGAVEEGAAGAGAKPHSQMAPRRGAASQGQDPSVSTAEAPKAAPEGGA